MPDRLFQASELRQLTSDAPTTNPPDCLPVSLHRLLTDYVHPSESRGADFRQLDASDAAVLHVIDFLERGRMRESITVAELRIQLARRKIDAHRRHRTHAKHCARISRERETSTPDCRVSDPQVETVLRDAVAEWVAKCDAQIVLDNVAHGIPMRELAARRNTTIDKIRYQIDQAKARLRRNTALLNELVHAKATEAGYGPLIVDAAIDRAFVR